MTGEALVNYLTRRSRHVTHPTTVVLPRSIFNRIVIYVQTDAPWVPILERQAVQFRSVLTVIPEDVCPNPNVTPN